MRRRPFFTVCSPILSLDAISLLLAPVATRSTISASRAVSDFDPLVAAVRSRLRFAPRLIQRSLYRMFMSYFMRDFNVVSVFLASGMPLLIFGVTWSAAQWIHVYRTNTPATTGTVMIGMLPIVLGFQLLLQALVLDVGNEPRRSR